MTEPTGYTALDLIGFTDKGDYDASTAYVQNDLVHYDNSIWRCLVDDTTGQTPAEGTYWTIFVESENAASGVTYDGTSSELSATNVQDAIDEVVDEKADSTIISDAYDSSTTYAAGDYFIYDNVLYHVDVACTGITPPNANYYTATSVSSEISNYKSYVVTGTTPTTSGEWVPIASLPSGLSYDNVFIEAYCLYDAGFNAYTQVRTDFMFQTRSDGYIYAYTTTSILTYLGTTIYFRLRAMS